MLGLAQRYVQVGADKVFKQRKGAPIGGPFSDICAALVLGMSEHFWRTSEPLRDLGKFGPRGLGPQGSNQMFPEVVAQSRYVDDVISATKQLCGSCVQDMIDGMYPGLPFEAQGTATGMTTGRHIAAGPRGPTDGDAAIFPATIEWLDICVHMQNGTICTAPKLSDVEWARGHTLCPEKLRLPPYLGRRHEQQNILYSRARSQIKR